MIEETYVAKDGSTVFDLYYVRDKVKVSGTVHKLDTNGNEIEKINITEWYRYGERLIFGGYFDNYVYDRVRYNYSAGADINTENSWVKLEGDLFVDIYVIPKSGVHYTVTHWIENVDGTGFEKYSTSAYTGIHSASVSAIDYVKVIFGFEVDSEQYESIILDADAENNLNVYYKRNVYEISFENSLKPECSVSYQLRYGADIPAPPADTTVPGYDFVKWNG